MELNIRLIVAGIAKDERDRALRLGDTEKAREWNAELARQMKEINRLRAA